MSTATDQQAKFDEAIASGKNEDEVAAVGDMALAFNQLGVSVVDSNGQLRDNQAVFSDVALTPWAGIAESSGARRIGHADLRKRRAGINPLIKAGYAEMATARLARRRTMLAAVMSEEDVAALEAFDDTLASLQAGLKGTLGTIAAAFLPPFNKSLDRTVLANISNNSGDVQRSNGDFGKMAEGLTGLDHGTRHGPGQAGTKVPSGRVGYCSIHPGCDHRRSAADADRCNGESWPP